MMNSIPVRRALWLGAWPLIVAAVPGCGGTIQFADTSAIAVQGTPPAPPAEEPKRVELREDRIQINEKIQFGYNSAKILEVSFPLLTEIAKVLNDNPRIKKVEIGGHASSEGSDEHNLELSDRRAKSVMKWLTGDGKVASDRLTAKGYGETKPLVADEGSDADREKNRRVELLIVAQDTVQTKVEVDPKTGKETIVESKVIPGGAQ